MVRRLGVVRSPTSPRCPISAGIEERREEEPERRDEPEHAEEDEHEVDRRLPEPANDPRSRALLDDDRGVHLRGRGGHLDLPPEPADVHGEHRDHEEEEEDGDRGAETEVVDAGE